MLNWSKLKKEEVTAEVIERMVKDYVMTSPLGDMSVHGIDSAGDPGDCEALSKVIATEIEPGERFWDEPVVGFAHGDDPIFGFLKQDIGEFFWTPQEVLERAFSKSDSDSAASTCDADGGKNSLGEGGAGVANTNCLGDDAGKGEGAVNSSEGSEYAAEAGGGAGAGVTVVSWVLPQTEAAKKEQGAEALVPTLRWILTRKAGTDFMYSIGKYVCEILNSIGIEAAVPVLTEGYGGQTSKKYGFASTWSERHVAYACGLGTFGLSEGLITSVGKAVRIGSIVINTKLETVERPYTSRDAYCTFYLDGSCKACIARCPAGAITEAGHDKVKCDKYKQENFVPYVMGKYGIKSATCGMCQTKVPCTSRIPAKVLEKK